MLITDDQVVIGFTALGTAITCLSGAVVYLFHRDSKCQRRLNQMNREFELVLNVLGEAPRKKKKTITGEHRRHEPDG